MKTRCWSQIAAMAVISLAAAVLLWVLIPAEIALPQFTFMRQESLVTPRLIPQIWAVLLLLVSTAHLLLALFAPDTQAKTLVLPAWTKSEKLRVLAAMTVVGSYIVWAIPVVGFYCSTTAYLVLGFILLGERSIVRIGLIALLTPAGLYFFFERLMGLLLPRGAFF